MKQVIIATHSIKANDELSRYSLNKERLSNRLAMRRGFAGLLESFSSQGLDILFLTDVPILKKDPTICIYREDSTRELCNASKTETKILRHNYYSEVAELNSLGQIKIFDSLDVFCEEDTCESYKDGKLLYFDSSHLTPYGASLLFKELLNDDILTL